MRRYYPAFILAGILTACVCAQGPAIPVQHVMIYHEPGRFGGWPANNGIWSWGDEIVVGFHWGYFQVREKGHAIDTTRPGGSLLARSLDGGQTWKLETPPFDAAVVPVDCPGGIDFTHPDFAMTLRAGSTINSASRFYYSSDRGRTWKGPFKLPLFGQKGIAARTDYLVNGKRDCMVFLTASKSDGKEGRAIATRTRDGGKTWKFTAYIGEEPKGYAIMPSTVRLSSKRLLTMIRRNDGPCWIDAYLSDDNGKTWQFLNRPEADTGWGNPPHLIKLRDGRFCLTYGYRTKGYKIPGSEIRARLSSDRGATWSDEITLRGNGGDWDIGYPRTVQRRDGRIVTVYYFNDDTAKERYIAATIWDPGKGQGPAR